MDWLTLESSEQLQAIKNTSHEKLALIFKHSTRCSISQTIMDRLERNWKQEEMKEVKLYFLDLVQQRSVSNQVSEEFAVRHESPQVLLIKNGQSIYNRSHFDINYKDLLTFTQRELL